MLPENLTEAVTLIAKTPFRPVVAADCEAFNGLEEYENALISDSEEELITIILFGNEVHFYDNTDLRFTCFDL